MHRAQALVFATVACVALAGCGNKAPSGQVVATVKGKEVTSSELNNELNGFAAPNAQIRKAAEQQALSGILARKVLAQAAEKAGVDKTPEFALQERRMHDTLLVQTWQNQIAKTVPAPSKEEVDKFISEHPNLYSEHKIFSVEQMRFPRPTDAAVIEEFKPLKTLQQLAALLTAHNIPYQLGQAQIDSLAIGPETTEQVLKLPPDEIFVAPAGNLLVANHITESRVVPFTGDAASKQASAYLKQRRTQQAIQRQFGSVVAAAKKDIVYSKAFEPPPAPKKTAAAPGAAPPKAK